MKQSSHTFVPLFLAILIDGMGLGILFPLLDMVIIDPQFSILPHGSSLFYRDFVYGVTVSCFMLSWFFGAAILGDLSDGYGRRKALMLCLYGSAVGYLISAVGINLVSLSFIIVGRVIDGFTAGSQPIAQAAVIDLSDKTNKAKNMGLLLFASSLGFILGPLIGGILVQKKVVAVMGYAAPLYFAAFISILNALLIQFCFHDETQVLRKVKVNVLHAFALFTSAFKNKGIRGLSIVLLIFMLGWAEYFTFLPVYTFKQFGASAFQTGLIMATLGVGFGIGTGFLIKPLNARFTLKQMLVYGALLTGLLILGTLIVENLVVTWTSTVILGTTVAVLYTALITLFSEQVDVSQQGWVMGVSGSVMAMSFAVMSFLMPFIAHLGTRMPLILTACFIILSGLCSQLMDRRHTI